jgi:putative glutamine amidotransferase
LGTHPFHIAGEKYIDAVRDGVEALALLLPVLEPPYDPEEVLALADGLLLTGSPSNVAPHRYGGPPPRQGVLLDERRDLSTLELITRAIDRGVPLLCLCRGFQELNVALGGTLHQHVNEVPGKRDHRADPAAPLDVQYGPAHTVSLVPGGLLARITGFAAIEVNSLHAQGIDRLADRLVPEAIAPDGLIEAVRVKDAKTFALGLQWHPEWKMRESPVSLAIFRAFGEAVRARKASRTELPHERRRHA